MGERGTAMSRSNASRQKKLSLHLQIVNNDEQNIRAGADDRGKAKSHGRHRHHPLAAAEQHGQSGRGARNPKTSSG